MKKKETRGGFRANAKRPSKYGEETENITFRVPKSRKAEVRKLVNDHLKQYVVESRRGDIVTTYDKDVDNNVVGKLVVEFNQEVGIVRPFSVMAGQGIVSMSANVDEKNRRRVTFEAVIQKSKL